ncbi:transcription termination factor NusA [Brochothrix campestris]|uniref:Transcription termination/antitermination protein NusA n=1 Tax=Brochothrix campestris FSL F6-1037 TaxID=1265861 RepID=W7CNL1_9LIST|nr:transcription termination factor NusA [Brochothrix campestris]EUJ41124.1 transcription elongation factor NusA [Brochothrix campestris FSL F6-1037]
MGTELLDALTVLESEKGIEKDFIIEALEAALESAYKRNFDQAQNVRVDINQTTGSMHVYAQKEVVDEILDSRLEITLEQAHEYNSAFAVGDTVEIEVTPRDFGRVAAQTAKQVVTQRVREAERGIIYNEFIDREDDIMTGIVERQDSRFIYVNLGKVEAILSKNEQMPNERYHAHDRIKVYITKVEKTSKGPQIYVSRTHPGLLKRLFEIEVPEIYDGLVEIKSVSREAGDRSKISVFSSDPEIDAVGSCVGTKGQRVQAIVDELKGEKIDIVEWSENPVEFVSNALSPAQVVNVTVDPTNQSTTVVVPDYQLSLAIGKRGQNARLAAKLTGWKIDIKNETNAAELGIFPFVEGAQADKEAEAAPVEVETVTAEVTAEPVVTEEVVEEVTAPTFVVDIEPAANTEE